MGEGGEEQSGLRKCLLGLIASANPGLDRDKLTVTCRDGHIQEVRICLTRDLEPRRCGADVIRDCTLSDARLMAID